MRIEIGEDGTVLLDGTPAGRAKTHALDGRPLAAIPPGIIPPGHFYLHADHSDSHDSRYAEICLCGSPIPRIGLYHTAATSFSPQMSSAIPRGFLPAPSPASTVTSLSISRTPPPDPSRCEGPEDPPPSRSRGGAGPTAVFRARTGA